MSAPSIEGNLARRIEELREERGDSVELDDVADVVESLIASMDGEITGVQIRLRVELRGLIDFIEQAKSEIAALSPGVIHDEHIPIATDELDAVVKATEEATGTILDAAEELEAVAAELTGEVAARITSVTNKIYEASNFQDLTGQRITKVVNALRHIETKVRTLAEACGIQLEREFASTSREISIDDERSMLNGPARPGEGNSQDDIDALLASFD